MDYFKKLPDEITLEILSRVPSESALDCKLVCKFWGKIVSHDPSFAEKHLHHLNHPSTAEDSCKLNFLALTEDGLWFIEYNENENYIESIRNRKMITKPAVGTCLIGSCNGLICLARREPERPIIVCNPFTRKYVKLPEIRIDSDDFGEYLYWSFGFGYISLTNEYKVVGIRVPRSDDVQVYIYTLGSGNGWRNLGKFNSDFCPDYHYGHEHGRFANGAIYWVGGEIILTFDLIQEKFCEHLAPPTLPPNTSLGTHTVGVLDGSLYAAIYDEEDEMFDLWLFKKKNDNHDKKEGEEHQSLGWCKEFRIDSSESLAVTKGGGVLSYDFGGDDLRIYDIKASTSQTLVDFNETVFRIFPHKNTFVWLKELGEEDTETM